MHSTSFSLSPCLLVSLSGSLLHLDNRSARVMAAVRANDVRRLHRAALRACLKLLGLEPVVRAPHTGARVGLFAFGDTHDGYLLRKMRAF
jgi:hypothetical protein